MNSENSTRSWNDFFQTMFLLLLFNLANICWKSINPILKTVGLIIPLAALLTLSITFIVRRKKVCIPFFFIPLALFLPLQILLIPHTPVPAASKRFVPVLVNTLVMFILIYNLLRSNWKTEAWEDALIGMGILYAALGLYTVWKWYSLWWAASGFPSIPPAGFRLGGSLIGHPNHFAVFLNLIIPFVLVRFYHNQKQKLKVLWAVLLALFLTALFYTSSRGGWIAAASAIFFSSLMYFSPRISFFLQSDRITPRKITFTRRTLVLIGCTAVGLSVIIFLLFMQVQRTSHVPIFSSRGYIWKPAWQSILESPFSGQGPGSFAFLYTAYDAPPPNWITGHAHNMLLQIWLEYGVPGLVLAASAFTLISCSIFRLLRSSGTAPVQTAPAAGALAGVLTHNLFDYAFGQNLLTVIALILCSIILAADKKHKSWSVKPLPVFIGILSAASALFIVSKPILEPEYIYWRGIQPALQGDWENSRESFCAAADNTPDHPFFSIQCAIADANYNNTRNDPDYAKAVEMMTSGITRDIYWPVHTAALASIQWKNHETAEALDLMSRAAIQAPEIAAFHLNLGIMLEAEHADTEAQLAFMDALKTDPSLAFSLVMQQTGVREAAVQSFSDQVESAPGSIFSIDTRNHLYLDWMGSHHLNQGNIDKAQEYFTLSLQEKESSAIPRIGLAEVHFTNGDFDKALHLIQEALFLSPTSVDAHFLYGTILRESGEHDRAAEEFEQAFTLMSGKSFSKNYFLLAYGMYAPQPDLPRFFIDGNLTRERVQALEWLVEYHVQNNSADRSERIQEYIRVQRDLSR